MTLPVARVSNGSAWRRFLAWLKTPISKHDPRDHYDCPACGRIPKPRIDMHADLPPRLLESHPIRFDDINELLRRIRDEARRSETVSMPVAGPGRNVSK